MITPDSANALPCFRTQCRRQHCFAVVYLFASLCLGDLSGRYVIAAQEAQTGTAVGAQSPEEKVLAQSFQAQDIDGDKKWNETEFLGSTAAADVPKAKQEFAIYDLDGDQKLTFDELRNIPSRVTQELRGSLPSPFAKLVDQHLVKIAASWNKWDSDQNGTLSEAEFQASGVAGSIPGLVMTTWKDWDRDGDGSLSQADCQRLLEAGYGIRRLDGQLLQLPSGQVVYWWHFKELDVNRDDLLTAAEFELESSDRAGREARFQRDDTDKNGEVSFKEWADSPNRRVDPLAEFLATDKNSDGRIDPAELQTGTASWLKRVTTSVFPGFDLNRDGTLSLHEYWATLIINRVENWLAWQEDRDHDGRLGPTEVAWLPGLELSLLKAEYFRRFDVDRNGYLHLNEFPFIIDTAKVPPNVLLEVNYRALDTDGDGQLNGTEFVAAIPVADQPRVKQEFAVFDLDRDGKLTFEEYRCIPSRVPAAARGSLPSPFANLVTERLAPINAGWPKWDTDKSGTLNEAEFQAAKLSHSLPGLEKSTWADWDRDGDGSLSQADCRGLLEAGFGIRRLDGQLLHQTSGLIVYWWHFKELDVNHDDRLTHAEFELESSDRASREARFQHNDTDKNGEVSFKEWADSTNHKVDPVAEFMAVDKNLDGLIDPAELQAGTPSWLKRLMPAVFPGFDLDRDGALSLHEYWATLLVNRVENWLTWQQDLDHDGRLGPTEFAWLPGPELALLKAEYFRRFDVDRNGFLQLDEFPFLIDAAKVSPDVLIQTTFRGLDTNGDGQLQDTEYIGSVPEVDRPRARQELKVFDRNGDGTLSVGEFRGIPSRVPFEARGNLASPFMKLVEEHMAPIAANWSKWDADRNGTLSQFEFVASGINRSIPEMATSQWPEWDRDGNGSLSQAECRLVFEAAYGIRRLNGQLLHLPSGQIVYWWHFKELDKNRDERLTKTEFEQESSDRAGRDARFQQDDTDQNGEVSFNEWAASRNHRVDPVTEFLAIDKNLDARIDQAELEAGTGTWLDRLTPTVFPGFDLDRDGLLTLDEYWSTLLVNRVENWLTWQEDRNRDGKLDRTEFTWMRGVELSLLKAEYFRRFDVNRNGFLQLDEFPFIIDTRNAPSQTVFQQHDKNGDGVLNLDEALDDLKPSPEAGQPVANKIRAARIEEKFQHADTDRDDYISLKEFETPLGSVVLDRDVTYQTWSIMNSHSLRREIPSRPWLIPTLISSIVLMSGAIVYLFIRY